MVHPSLDSADPVSGEDNLRLENGLNALLRNTHHPRISQHLIQCGSPWALSWDSLRPLFEDVILEIGVDHRNSFFRKRRPCYGAKTYAMAANQGFEHGWQVKALIDSTERASLDFLRKISAEVPEELWRKIRDEAAKKAFDPNQVDNIIEQGLADMLKNNNVAKARAGRIADMAKKLRVLKVRTADPVFESGRLLGNLVGGLPAGVVP